MKGRKEPLRTCIVTKEKTNKYNLIRVVKNVNGEVFVDKTSKANGKGAYLKKDLEVINKACQHKILDRVLETTIPAEVYEELRKIVNLDKDRLEN